MKRTSRRRYRIQAVLNQLLIVCVTMIGAVMILTPVLWMVSAAIRPIKEILVYPPKLIPQQVTMEYFVKIMGDERY